MIARDHDHSPDAEGAKSGQRRPRCWARRIKKPNDTEIARAASHHHQGSPLQSQLSDDRGCFVAERRYAVDAEHLRLPYPDRLAVQLGGHALARQALEVDRGRDDRIAQACATVARDGLRQRVVAEPFDRHSDRQKIALLRPAHRHDVGDPRPSLGQGAGLVEGDGVERAEVLQRRAALDQDTGARRTGDAREDGARGGDGERARTRGDQHGHGAIEAVAERLIDDDPGEQQDKGERQHHRHEDAFEPVREALGRRLLRLGLTHHPNHLGQGGVARCAGRLNLDGA